MVSPLHFNKDIIKAPSHRRLAYQKLEEILEQEGSVNPYQVMLFGPDPEETTPDHQTTCSTLTCMTLIRITQVELTPRTWKIGQY